jgi:hypothetical protein
MNALTLIKTANQIRGYNLAGQELEFDYKNFEPEEDDIVIAGYNCTIFKEDLDTAIVKGNTIYFPNHYVLHVS